MEKINEKELVNIKVEQIFPHPQNPRKDLGDLSELAESIKKKGIMQNLMVVPKDNDGEYTVLIGHRRLAAAKQAGLKEIPCKVIKGLNEREQLSVMLEENMQREDLTIYEQAQGFQMMLDLGETEETIASKTGFSKTTIRHRLNIAKLDKKALQKKERDESFQMTLKDLYALEKVGDIKTRNKILREATSSRDLAWKSQNAVLEAKRQKHTEMLIKILTQMGIKEAPAKARDELYTSKWERMKVLPLDKEPPKRIGIKELAQKEKLYYMKHYRDILIIREKKQERKKETEEEKRKRQQKKKRKEIRALTQEMCAVRKEFIENICSGKIEPLKEVLKVQNMLWNGMVHSRTTVWNKQMADFFFGKNYYELSEEENGEMPKKVETLDTTQQMLISLWTATKEVEFCGEDCRYNEKNLQGLKIFYEVLELYGLLLNEEEKQLLTGTHELYMKDTEKSGMEKSKTVSE